jgi:hypothetical protein
MRRRARSLGAPLAGALLAGALLGLGAGPAAAADPVPAPTPAVSPPSQEQIDDAKAALDRLRNQGKKAPAQLTQVAGTTAEEEPRGVTSRISNEAWWTIGAGLLVLMVASETTRVSTRRAKHRREA